MLTRHRQRTEQNSSYPRI